MENIAAALSWSRGLGMLQQTGQPAVGTSMEFHHSIRQSRAFLPLSPLPHSCLFLLECQKEAYAGSFGFSAYRISPRGMYRADSGVH